MNRHDKKRKDDLIKTLLKAKEQADNAHLYLSVHGSDPDEIMNVGLVLELLETSMEHLGALVPV